MKKASVILILLVFSTVISAHDEHLKPLLDEQIDAFNQQDVKRMVANVSDDFKYFYINADEMITETEGKTAFEESMKSYFKSVSKPKSSIDSYVIDGQRISFKEIIRYENALGQKKTSSAMGIYQFKDDKIIRAWYFVD